MEENPDVRDSVSALNWGIVKEVPSQTATLPISHEIDVFTCGNGGQNTFEFDLADSYSNSTACLLAIEHPAILTSAEAGIKSLGGYKQFNKVHQNPLPFAKVRL